jgi:hypothetical protein
MPHCSHQPIPGVDVFLTLNQDKAIGVKRRQMMKRSIARMKSTVLTAMVLVCFGFWNSAGAKTNTVPTGEPQVTIDLPDAWQIKDRDCDSQTGTPENDLGFYFSAMMAGTNATQVECVTCLSQLVKETLGYACAFKPEGASMPIEDAVIDGAKAFKTNAKGKINGVDTVVVAYYLPVSKKGGLAFAYWGTPAAIQKHADLIKKSVESMRRIKK